MQFRLHGYIYWEVTPKYQKKYNFAVEGFNQDFFVDAGFHVIHLVSLKTIPNWFFLMSLKLIFLK